MEDYRLEQSGQEVQNILNGAAMQTDLTAEVERATEAEGGLRQGINDEAYAREQADSTLDGKIDAEEIRAKAAEKQNADDIDAIEEKIPAAASSSNKLADVDFVNSSISTATATFRGAYNLVSDLHLAVDATHEQIATLLGTVINEADKNDYAYVQIPTSAETPTQIASVEKYTFTPDGWEFAYALNNSGFTAAQWAAINSGITSGLVATLNSLPGLIHDEELARIAADGNLSDGISAINGKIPATASSENKLVDLSQMNSAISTATAEFKGTYNLVADLGLSVDATHAQIAAMLDNTVTGANNNDYAFVQIPTSAETPTQIASVERYKFNGTNWAFEFVLNNSGFTAAQWAALNSGITSGLVAKLSELPTYNELVLLLAAKQDTLTFDATPTENSNNPVKSGGVYAADLALHNLIDAINLLIPSTATSSNKLADVDFVNSSISTATATFRGTYNLVSDLHLGLDATHAQIALLLDSVISTADNNDYAFVQIPTSVETPTEIASVERYKFNGTNWVFEFVLNNSGFTAAQWAAINSGITSALVTKLSGLPTSTELNALIVQKILEATPAFKGQFTTLADLQAVASPKDGDYGIVRTKDSDGYDVFTVYQYLNSQWNVFYSLSYHPIVKPASTGTTGDYPYNGMGYVELERNEVQGVPTLTQDMFYKGEVGSRVPNTNTIFVIKYDYVLAENITIPSDCVLKFEGGSISGVYTLNTNKCFIKGEKCISTDVTVTGLLGNEHIFAKWFKGNDNNILQKCFNWAGTAQEQINEYQGTTFNITYKGVELENRIYNTTEEITLPNSCHLIGNNCIIKRTGTGNIFNTGSYNNYLYIENITFNGVNNTAIYMSNTNMDTHMVTLVGVIIETCNESADNYALYLHSVSSRILIDSCKCRMAANFLDIASDWGEIKNCWIDGFGSNFIKPANSCSIVDKCSNLVIRDCILVPEADGVAQNKNVRWIDLIPNGSLLLDKCRFSGENGGIPIVWKYTNGSNINITNSWLYGGRNDRLGGVVVLMNDVLPYNINIDKTNVINNYELPISAYGYIKDNGVTYNTTDEANQAAYDALETKLVSSMNSKDGLKTYFPENLEAHVKPYCLYPFVFNKGIVNLNLGLPINKKIADIFMQSSSGVPYKSLTFTLDVVVRGMDPDYSFLVKQTYSVCCAGWGNINSCKVTKVNEANVYGNIDPTNFLTLSVTKTYIDDYRYGLNIEASVSNSAVVIFMDYSIRDVVRNGINDRNGTTFVKLLPNMASVVM